MGKRPKEEYQLSFTEQRPLQKRRLVLQEPECFSNASGRKRVQNPSRTALYLVRWLSAELGEGRLLLKFLHFFSFL